MQLRASSPQNLPKRTPLNEYLSTRCAQAVRGGGARQFGRLRRRLRNLIERRGRAGQDRDDHRALLVEPNPADTQSVELGTGNTERAGECTTADLKVTRGQSNGAAGTIYYNIDFTNTSSSSCFVQGYPGVSLVSAGNGAGTQIGTDAKRVPVTPSHQIVLAPGQTANAALGVAEAGNFPASSCNPVTAHWLKVFPPDQTVAAYVAFTTQTCASTTTATMHISAITSGA